MAPTAGHQLLVILDFGSQYTQLIARRVRELNVYCEIHPFDVPIEKLRELNPKAMIFSGGPASLTRETSPRISSELIELGIPILGICYGMQMISELTGGAVVNARRREYGRAPLHIDNDADLFAGMPTDTFDVWMSHGDKVDSLPEGFTILASTGNAPHAAIGNPGRKLYGLQFHPEVSHTTNGTKLLSNFLYNICGYEGDWTPKRFVEEAVQRIRQQVGDTDHVLLGLSGGVDSSVAAVLISKAIGDRLLCVFVDNGLLRKDEVRQVEDTLGAAMHLNMVTVPAGDRFLNELKGITEPEQKRKVIGRVFIEVFEDAAQTHGPLDWLAQGTIYPDVIESVSTRGPSATIKSHHNVGGLPDRMKMKLLEPLRELFKDEVRAVGRELGIEEHILMRHPFPGPGLGVRILGEVTAEQVRLLQEADAIYMDELEKSGWYQKTSQSFTVLLPVRAVGVMGDERTYEQVAAIRAVITNDFMTADWAPLPHDLLSKISTRIINEVRGINRVVYDISSKPPATIEWE